VIVAFDENGTPDFNDGTDLRHNRFPIAGQGFRPRIMALVTRPGFALSSIWKPEALRF
jgi:hypothetical protein